MAARSASEIQYIDIVWSRSNGDTIISWGKFLRIFSVLTLYMIEDSYVYVEYIPLEITELWILTELEFSMWMPSVLGLDGGDVIRRELMWTSWHPSNVIWNCGLFLIVTPCILRFELMKNLKACPHQNRYIHYFKICKNKKNAFKYLMCLLTAGLSHGPVSAVVLLTFCLNITSIKIHRLYIFTLHYIIGFFCCFKIVNFHEVQIKT